MRNIVSVVLALYIMCVSGGVDVYHYCCDACRDYGHNIYRTITCDEVHGEHRCTDSGCTSHHSHEATSHHHTPSDLCSHIAQTSRHCDVHHFDAPQLTVDNSHVSLPAIPVAAILAPTIDIDFIQTYSLDNEVNAFSNAPPLLDGRAILVLKNSYLI